jgi:hypothetical protein
LVGELRAFLDLGAIQLIKEPRTLGDVRVTANADAVAPRQAADIVVR